MMRKPPKMTVIDQLSAHILQAQHAPILPAGATPLDLRFCRKSRPDFPSDNTIDQSGFRGMTQSVKAQNQP